MDAAIETTQASSAAGVEIRRLEDLRDAELAMAVMTTTWGDGQPWSVELMRAMEAAGNLVLGAFDTSGLRGFALGFYGDEGGMHFHSHMLAVLPEAQRRGIGYALKMAQREACLSAGVEVMRWTFDPLQTRNAAFNLEKVGAVAEAFARDFYGTMRDAQSLGDRGDRLWARWDLTGSRSAHTGSAARTVGIPGDYWEVQQSDPAAAQGIRDTVAYELEEAFANGLTAVAFREGGYVFA